MMILGYPVGHLWGEKCCEETFQKVKSLSSVLQVYFNEKENLCFQVETFV